MITGNCLPLTNEPDSTRAPAFKPGRSLDNGARRCRLFRSWSVVGSRTDEGLNALETGPSNSVGRSLYARARSETRGGCRAGGSLTRCGEPGEVRHGCADCSAP